jgi:hypothetical protein
MVWTPYLQAVRRIAGQCVNIGTMSKYLGCCDKQNCSSQLQDLPAQVSCVAMLVQNSHTHT